MRLTPLPVQAVAQLYGSRPRRQATQATSSADLAPRLPGAVADRLAVLMAQDPGLAEAVSARLPEARAASARDLAAFSPPASGSTIDIRS